MSDPAPYPGALKVGSSGLAVDAIQQGLHSWGAMRKKTHPHEALLRATGATGYFGKPTGLQCGHVQAIHHKPVTNTFGPVVHDALAPYYSDYSKKLLVELHDQALLDAWLREVNAMQHTVGGYLMNQTRRPGWSYHMDGLRFSIIRNDWDWDTVDDAEEDCTSTSATLQVIAAQRVGLAAPAYWTALGKSSYTGNMIEYGASVSIKGIRIGDRVHYANNTHMGTYMGLVQGVPAVLSFGGEPGPLPRPLTYRPITAIRRDY